MWNSYGLELGWVGVAVLAFGLALFLMDLFRRVRDDLAGLDPADVVPEVNPPDVVPDLGA